MSVRRSARKNKGQSPSRLGSADGWADVAPSKWGGVDHKEVEYDEDASYSEHDDDEDLSGAAEPEEASGETKIESKLISEPESLGPTGIIVLFLVALLNLGVVVYTALASAGFEDVKGTPIVYVSGVFALAGAGIPLWYHFAWLLAPGE
eukprot:m.139730 g.139730  ORF g.139730 m.139730 type:complete len:149 (+) comp14020_c0_seq11:103-549(+)